MQIARNLQIHGGGGTRSLKNIPLLAGTSYRLHLMLLLAASNMEPAVLDRFEILVESIVYYTVINRVTTNDIERIFVKWCGQIRGIKTSDELDAFIGSSVLPEVSRWKEDNEANFMRLESTINRSIHNSTYQDKCVDYRQSTVYLTSSLPELVDVGKNNAITKANEKLKAWPEWNKTSIMERQAMLYKLSEEIWMSDAIWNLKKSA